VLWKPFSRPFQPPHHDLAVPRVEPSSTSSTSNSFCSPRTLLHHLPQVSLPLTHISPSYCSSPLGYTTYPPLRARAARPIHLIHFARSQSTKTPNIVLKIVTIDVKKVIVETWQPNPAVRSSKRSEPRAQMDPYLIGDSNGNARDSESVGNGRHVDDYTDV
jgi:hypothetical protein